jgi:glycosyltransferase involved in cell wall biosynthesis
VKVLFLPKHEYLGASSRYRTLQYLPYLKDHIDFDISPLFSDEYLKYKYTHKKENKSVTLKRILNRIKTILLSASKYDLLVIEKELLPYFPPFLEYYLKVRNIPYIVDYDDAVWHNYDHHRKRLVRTLLRNKIKTVIKNASIVIAGSEYIIEYAKRARAKQIIKIPTVIDISKYKCNEIHDEKESFVIGWIGSPSSSQYLFEIDNILKQFTDKYDAVVNLIGFDSSLSNKLNFRHIVIPWKEESEVREICKFDVGIMPLPDTPFERGKCGFKLIQYMGCKKPVIASPIGENNYIIDHEKNGFLASGDKDWYTYLEKLYHSKDLCNKMGENSYQKTYSQYSLQMTQDIYLSTIINDKGK